MLTLIYRSDAAALMPFSALSDICFQSALKNQRLGVTGFLVEHEGTFLQVLEGDTGIVDRLYERIAKDQRHRHVSLLSRESSNDQRSFSFWSMNFGPVNDPGFWTDGLEPFQERQAFRQRSYSLDFALQVLTRAYTYACILADADPVIGDFIQGRVPTLTTECAVA